MSHVDGPLYPLWLRVLHWTQAALFIALLVSGASLHFAGSGVSFRWAVLTHNICGVGLGIAWFAFVVTSAATGNWRHYLRRRQRLLLKLFLQFRYYAIGIFLDRRAPFPPRRNYKFNPAQQLTYVGVVSAGMLVLVVSGLLLLAPHLAPASIGGASGVLPVALLHIGMSYLLTTFLVAHVYLATMGRTWLTHFREMWTGRRGPSTEAPNEDSANQSN